MKKRILNNFVSFPTFALVTILCIFLPRRSSAASLSKFAGTLKNSERIDGEVLSEGKRLHRQKRRIGVRIPHLVRKETFSNNNGRKRKSGTLFTGNKTTVTNLLNRKS